MSVALVKIQVRNDHSQQWVNDDNGKGRMDQPDPVNCLH